MRRSKGVQLYLRPARRRGGQNRWVILDPEGRPRERSTGALEPDRATAERALAAYLAAKHTPNFGSGNPAEVLITDGLAFYAADKAERGGRDCNLAGSLINLGTFFADKCWSELTPLLCHQYVDWRISQGDRRTLALRPLKATTARNDLIVLEHE